MKVRNTFVLALAAAAAAACNESTGPNTPTRPVALSFQSSLTPAGAVFGAGAGALAAASFGAPVLATAYLSGDTVVVVDGSDTLKITRVRMTLREIELERDDQTVDCSSNTGSGDSTDDDCEDHIDGPVFVDLNLVGGPAQFTVPAVIGSYDTIEFKFDVAHEDDASHVAYRAAHPEMATVSVKVNGLFNGTPFEFDLDVEIEKEVGLATPLVVSETETTFSVDIQFDVPSWFVRLDGSLIDPNAVCQLPNSCPDRERIEYNMEEGVESHGHDD